MIRITDNSFQAEVLYSSLPVLVDFGAPWCGPCKILDPIVEELGVELLGRLKVGKVNIEECPATMETYRIRGLPTVMIFKNGEVVEQIVGPVSKAKLMATLENHTR